MLFKKGFITLVTAMALLAMPQAMDAAIFLPEYNPFGPPLTVHVNGRYIPSDTQPVLQNNRVLLPMRAAAEAIDATVEWNSTGNCISVQKDGNTALFYVGRHTYTLNGVQKTTDVAPTVKNNRTLLPIRAFAEALNAHVEWNATLYDVDITIPGAYQPSPHIPAALSPAFNNIIQKYYVPATKPGIGSWFCAYYSNYETYYDMLFVSELPDGRRQAIEVASKDCNNDDVPDFAVIWLNSVTDLGDKLINHRGGMDAQIYNSDTFIGQYVFTYTGNEIFTYGSPYSDTDLIRIKSDGHTTYEGEDCIFYTLTN